MPTSLLWFGELDAVISADDEQHWVVFLVLEKSEGEGAKGGEKRRRDERTRKDKRGQEGKGYETRWVKWLI